MNDQVFINCVSAHKTGGSYYISVRNDDHITWANLPRNMHAR